MFVGDITRAALRQPTVSFELNVRNGLVETLLPTGGSVCDARTGGRPAPMAAASAADSADRDSASSWSPRSPRAATARAGRAYANAAAGQ